MRGGDTKKIKIRHRVKEGGGICKQKSKQTEHSPAIKQVQNRNER